jgi:signal peptidase I
MKKKDPEKTPHRWRENVEALTMAIVVALLFKYFVLEISKIPSGSMQPTLMGSPEAQVFDRTLVDKLVYRMRDPERFEIVVFKHPLERSRVMVKRLVGMPGEDLRIQHGDLWTRPDEREPWRILRRPPAVQAAMWRALRPDPRGREWNVVRGKGWLVEPDALRARGDGAARFRESSGPIRNDPLDGYPPALLGELAPHYRPAGTHTVGDLRLTGELTALAGTTAVAFELTEGQRLYELVLPGPAAPADATARIRVRDSKAGTERVENGSPVRLEAGETVDFAVENLDDRLALELDGELLVATEIEPSERQDASLTVTVTGAGADLEELEVARDIYYLPAREHGTSWEVEIGPESYVMLGDNTHDSADSRLWEAVTYAVAGGEGPLRGNYRENDAHPSSGRLADDTRALRLRDEWGELHWFASAGARAIDRSGAPLVPRELILGRAIAVFWPIRPVQGLWRLGWLH